VSSFFLGIVMLSVVTHVVYFLAWPHWPNTEWVESYRVARSLAERGEFADAWRQLDTGATGCVAPGFPWLLSFAHRGCNGDRICLLRISLLFSAVSWGLMLALLPAFSWKLVGARVPGYIAAGLGLLPVFPIYPTSEVEIAALLLLVVCLLGVSPAFPAWLLGAACGLAALVHPAVAVASLPFAVAFRRRPARTVCVAALAFVAVIAPWMIRNRLVMGGWFYLRSNVGLELYTANRDGAPFTQAEAIAEGERWPHPNQNIEEAVALRDMGELAYMRSRGSMAAAWMREHPAQLARNVGLRALAWFAPWRSDLTPLPYLAAVVSLGGLAGLAFIPTRARWTILSSLLAFSGPYWLASATARYKTPILWMFLFGCGYAIREIVRRFGSTARGLPPVSTKVHSAP
jgi:hypothetical protein